MADSHLTILPASRLGAVYHPSTKKLELYAAGHIPSDRPPYDLGFHVEQAEPDFRGPKFALKGHLAGSIASGGEHFEVTKEHEVPDLRPGDSVEVQTMNYTQAIGIEWSDTGSAKEVAKHYPEKH